MTGFGHLPLQTNSRGFTIVELLIVIVVIGILATLTIVGYTGISQRATTTGISSDLLAAVKRLKLDQIDLGSYPATVALANNGKGLQASNGNTFQYTVDNSQNPRTFCLTATNGSVSYYVTQDATTPTLGACPGHAVGGPATITNFIPNPGFEIAGTPFWTSANSTAFLRDTSTFVHGPTSLRLTMPASASSLVGAGYVAGASAVPSILQANTTYTISGYVYVPTATTTAITISLQGTGYASKVNGASATTNVKNSWVRISNTFTTNGSGSISIYFLNSSTTTAGMVFWLDDVMLTQGANVYNYADGSFIGNGWTWTGTTQQSPSTGPVL